MKQCFTKDGVKTADWIQPKNSEEIINWANEKYPIVAKHHFGSRGAGNTKLDNKEDLVKWLNGKSLINYIFEKYHDFVREYRLHVTKEGCFYTCRKMLKSDTPPEKRWFRNDSNSSWILESNPDFDKPKNWEQVIKECVKACISVELDFCAVDLKIQSSKDSKGNIRKEPEFIVIEVNSAPSFGDLTAQKYLEEIPKILKRKHQELK